MARRRLRRLLAIDNLEGMGGLPSNSVALAYLDPPFNSGRTYDTIVASRHVDGHRREAFADTWRWSAETQAVEARLSEWVPRPVAEFLKALAQTLDQSGIVAYMMMMAPRLAEVRRLLRDDGSVYLHCDPTASHYLKALMDHIFGAENFRSEIVWKRTHAHSSSRRYGPVHDTILFYTKGPRYIWNPLYAEYSATYLEKHYRHEDSHGFYQLITCTAPGDRTGTRAHYEWRGQLPPPGRHWAWKREQMEAFEEEGRLVYSSTGVPRLKRYTDDGAGVPLQDLWTDINRLDAHSDERMGFDTQKPLQLLERIISASSNADDIIFDPFAGSGTTAVAAERLGRPWIAIDNSLLACSLTLSRVRQHANLAAVRLEGFPSDKRSAKRLLREEPAAFGLWGTSMLAAVPDRHGSNASLATGAGRLRVKSGSFELLTWVPLRSRIEMAVPISRHRRLAKLGFILNSGVSHRALMDWAGRRLGVPIHVVALESLVEGDSLTNGLANEVSIATAAGR
jgi:DNA modification methylase